MRSHHHFLVLGRILLAFLGVVVFAGLLSAGTESASDQRVILAGGDFDYRPYTFLDDEGRPVGLAVDILNKIAEKRGFSVRFEFTQWNEAIEQLAGGQVDVLLGILYTEERSRRFDFTIPYNSESYAIFVRRDSPIESLADLQGRRPVTLAGDASIEVLLRPLGLIDEAVYVESLPTAIETVAVGRYDYVLAPYNTGMEALESLRNAGYRPGIKVVGSPLMPSLYRFAVGKGRPELLADLNEGIDRLKSSGELERISRRWLVYQRPQWRLEDTVRWLAIILIPTVVLGGLLILWSWRLKKEIARKTGHLKSALQAAEKANLAKSRFLAGISHELRTPLNNILGFSQLLLSRKDRLPLPETEARFLRNIRTCGEMMAGIVGKVLDIAQIEAGRIAIEEEPVDLKNLAREIYDTYLPKALEKGVFLEYACDSELPPSVLSDRTRLGQILTNLVDNALKFTPPGGAVWLKIKREDDRLVIEVEDEGIGIAPDHQAMIFRPFEQVRPQDGIKQQGAGLGLAIVSEITQLMGGQIRLQSRQKQGTCIAVRLPLVITSAESRVAGLMENWESLRFSPAKRVVAVEDNPETRDYLRSLFKKMGISLILLENSATAVETILTVQPAMVLLDLHVSPFNGIEVTRMLRQSKIGQSLPIVIISADVTRDNQAAAQRAGATRFLGKPLYLERLLPLVLRYLASEPKPN